MTVFRHRGFTLVEVLVVLIITALVSTVLFQALAQIYKMQGRFGEQLEQSQGGAMRVDWYRQVLQGLVTDFPDGKQRFSGRRQHLEGLTATALTVSGGAPQWIKMDLISHATGGGELHYHSGEKEVQLLNWDGSGLAAFSYLDDNGLVHDQWPPEETGAWPQLPAAVLLNVPTLRGQEVWVAAPRASREAKSRSFVLGASP